SLAPPSQAQEDTQPIFHPHQRRRGNRAPPLDESLLTRRSDLLALDEATGRQATFRRIDLDVRSNVSEPSRDRSDNDESGRTVIKGIDRNDGSRQQIWSRRR